MTHLENPSAMTAGELYDEYCDLFRRANRLVKENALMYARQAALETWIRARVEEYLDHDQCLLGCHPVWSPKLGRYTHTEPCVMASGEQLLK